MFRPCFICGKEIRGKEPRTNTDGTRKENARKLKLLYRSLSPSDIRVSSVSIRGKKTPVRGTLALRDRHEHDEQNDARREDHVSQSEVHAGAS